METSEARAALSVLIEQEGLLCYQERFGATEAFEQVLGTKVPRWEAHVA